MSRANPLRKDLSPADDNTYAITGLCGALLATPFGILLSEHNNDFTIEDQIITLGFFMLGVLLRVAYTQSQSHTNTVARA